jgi:hypothetical protein
VFLPVRFHQLGESRIVLVKISLLPNQIIQQILQLTLLSAKRKYPNKAAISGKSELIEHEYKCHGTCCLTDGLKVATGEDYGYVNSQSAGGGLCLAKFTMANYHHIDN